MVNHREMHISLATLFAVLSLLYFAIGRRVGPRFPWHLAWGQFVLVVAGVVLMEGPIFVLAATGMPQQAGDAVAAFHFWNSVAAAGYLAIWAGLLLFVYLAFAGWRARKSVRG